ncbi:hypothetical protein BOX15_Mlig022325g2 [Macrostomum lignano]|uniref:Uncharacterized protein n=1 Tax=Macrostomum lignano TaxID=282301 RepID=A0A267GS65_9PLAT|nr:hypothetical protein BOX15_Mlig022325g2 [Macrostomum lignano]
MSTDQNRPLVQPPGYENIQPSTYGQYQPIPMQPHSGRWSNNGQQHGMQLPPQPPPPPPPPPPPQQQRQQQNLRDQIRAHNSSDYWFESASTISAINCELPPEEPPTPSAPPYNEMEKISGYDEILQPHVAYVAPPPSYQEAISNLATSTVENFLSGSSLTEMEARQLLIGLAKSKCCWSKRAAEDMLIKSLTQTTAVHYMVKTFLETRATDWASEPFRGQIIDGPQNGVPPPPWDIEVGY